MRPSVYIESSVVSYYTSRPARDIVAAAHQQITDIWWDEALPKLNAYVSQVVIDEISSGDAFASKLRIDAILAFDLLEVTSDVMELAEQYFQAIRIPEKARNDALHLSLATLNGMDYLVSWNCSHIASARVRGIVETINLQRGYATPIICTPEELMEV